MTRNLKKKGTVSSGKSGQVKTKYCSFYLICVVLCSVLHILICKDKNTPPLFQAKHNWKAMYLQIAVHCCFLGFFFFAVVKQVEKETLSGQEGITKSEFSFSALLCMV